MCFMKPPETPAVDPPVSDTTAADQLALGTNAVSQRNSSLLGRLGLMLGRTAGPGGIAPSSGGSSDGGSEATATDITPAKTFAAPTATPQTKTGGGTLGTLRGIVPHYLRKPPANP